MSENPLSTRPRSILFLCTTNICRGPLAAALFKLRKPPDCSPIVRSAGIAGTDGAPILSLAQQAAHKRGIDLSHHQARIATAHLPEAFDLILAMEYKQLQWIKKNVPTAVDRAWLLGHWRDQEIHPPLNGFHPDYEDIVETISHCVTDWTRRLRAPVGDSPGSDQENSLAD